MNAATSRKLVLVSVVLLTVLAAVRTAQGNETGSLYKRLWGIGVIGVILSVTADFAPTIAGPFAILVLLGSLTHGGDQVVQNVLASVSNRLPSGPSSTVVRTGPHTSVATVTSGGTTTVQHITGP